MIPVTRSVVQYSTVGTYKLHLGNALISCMYLFCIIDN